MPNRADLDFYHDSDEPSLHASSGITRNFKPKPSFHAVGHLYRSLGACRFSRILLKQEGEIYAYEFVLESDPKQKMLVA